MRRVARREEGREREREDRAGVACGAQGGARVSGLTLVLVSCRRRGDSEGCSPAPTCATKLVQNSISAMPIAPSADPAACPAALTAWRR